MHPILNRFLIATLLLVSAVIWLATSSVFANALHILAKSDYAWYAFGSISVWLSLIGATWFLIIGFAGIFRKLFNMKEMLSSLFAVSILVVMFAVVTTLTDQMLGSIGIAAILIWVFEISMGLVLVNIFTNPSKKFTRIERQANLAAVAMSWQVAIKILVLWVSPGISIRW